MSSNKSLVLTTHIKLSKREYYAKRLCVKFITNTDVKYNITVTDEGLRFICMFCLKFMLGLNGFDYGRTPHPAQPVARESRMRRIVQSV